MGFSGPFRITSSKGFNNSKAKVKKTGSPIHLLLKSKSKSTHQRPIIWEPNKNPKNTDTAMRMNTNMDKRLLRGKTTEGGDLQAKKILMWSIAESIHTKRLRTRRGKLSRIRKMVMGTEVLENLNQKRRRKIKTMVRKFLKKKMSSQVIRH